MSSASYSCYTFLKSGLKNIQKSNFNKIISVGAELVHGDIETYTEGRTVITKPIVAFRKSVNAAINRWRQPAKQK